MLMEFGAMFIVAVLSILLVTGIHYMGRWARGFAENRGSIIEKNQNLESVKKFDTPLYVTIAIIISFAISWFGLIIYAASGFLRFNTLRFLKIYCILTFIGFIIFAIIAVFNPEIINAIHKDLLEVE